MKSRWILAAAVLLLGTGSLLAGCWDYQELENRALIVGMGIDELPPKKFPEYQMRMYRVILQVVEPTAGGGSEENMTQGGAKQGGRRGYSNIVIDTPSLGRGFWLSSTMSDHAPNLAHLQLIALGEKVSRKGLDELYDFISRFPQMRRKTELLLVTGPIMQYFETESAEEPAPALHIAELLDNVQNTLMFPESNFGTMSSNTRAGTPFLLLKASMNPRREIVIDEAAVFHKFKMMGTVKRDEMKYLSMLRGDIHRDVLDFQCAGGRRAALQILRGGSKLKPSMRNGKPHVTFDVELETELTEFQCLGAAFDKPERIRNVERTYSRQIEEQMKKTANELKNKYRQDLFRFSTRLKSHPELYKPMRSEPETFFRELTVDVRVDLKIRNLGNSLKNPSKESK